MTSANRRESVARTTAEVYGLKESWTSPGEANTSASMANEVSVVVVVSEYVWFSVAERPSDGDSRLVLGTIWQTKIDVVNRKNGSQQKQVKK